MKTGIAAVLAATALLYATYTPYDTARQKIGSIESDRLRPGTRVDLTPSELNAYVQREIAETVPQGVRQPRLVLGQQVATGSALVDFAKLRRAQGQPPNWLMDQLLDGERPVRVTASIHSANGQATVDVESVEISGVTIQGQVLDYLVHNYLLPRYRAAKIGTPFQLGHHIERLDVQPSAVGVVIGR